MTLEEIYQAFLPLVERLDRDHRWFLHLAKRSKVLTYLSEGDTSQLEDGDWEHLPKLTQLANLLDSVAQQCVQKSGAIDDNAVVSKWLNEGTFPGSLIDYAGGEELMALLASIVSEYVSDSMIGLPKYNFGQFGVHPVPLDVFTKHMVIMSVGLDGNFAAALLYGTMETQQDEYFQYHMLEGIRVDEVIQLGTGYQLLPYRHDEAHLTGIYSVPQEVNGLSALRITKTIGPVFSNPNTTNRLESEDTFPEQTPMDVLKFCDVLSLVRGSMVREVGSWSWTARIPNVWDCPPYRRTIRGTHPQQDMEHTSGRGLKEDAFPAVLDLYSRYCNLNRRARNALHLATSRWAQATLRQPGGDALIDLRIALECLFTADGNAELAYRLSHRAAWWAASTPDERVAVVKDIRHVYNTASRIIHGGQPSASVADEERVSRVRQLMRRGIIKSIYCGGFDRWDELVAGFVLEDVTKAHTGTEELLMGLA